MAVDFKKLARVNAKFRPEVERNSLLSRISAAEQSRNPTEEFCRIADESILDWAYDNRKFLFSEAPPPKNEKVYEVIGVYVYRTTIGLKIFDDITGVSEEEEAQLREEAEERKSEIMALQQINDKYWDALASCQISRRCGGWPKTLR